MPISVIKRDEFYSALEAVRENTKTARNDLFAALEAAKSDLMEVCKDARDLIKAQNGRVYENTAKISEVVGTLKVLEERIMNISTTMKDNTARWMSMATLIGLALEILRHFVKIGP